MFDLTPITKTLTWIVASVLTVGLGVLLLIAAGVIEKNSPNSQMAYRLAQAAGLTLFLGGGSLLFSVVIFVIGVPLYLSTQAGL